MTTRPTKTARRFARHAALRLGFGERLVLVGHEIMLLSPGDDGEQNVYTSEDWRACASPSYEIEEDGDLRRHNGERCYGHALGYRFARCPSEADRFARLFVRTFVDTLRIAA